MPKTVLIADDDPDVRLVVGLPLEAQKIRVVEASDGKEVLEAVARDRPDLIIMDWTMPGLSGPDLLRALQQDSPGTPVIVLSGQANEAEIALGRSLGAYAYLIKPVPMKKLMEIVNTALGQSAPGSAASAP